MIATLAWTAVLAMSAAWLTGALAFPLSSTLVQLAPKRQARWVLLLLVAPTIVFVTVFIAILAPSILARVGLGVDHCLAHGDHHIHLCLNHPTTGALLPLMLTGIMGARSLTVAISACFELFQQRRQTALLARLGETHGPVVTVRTNAVVSFVEASLRPRIFVTEGLRRALSDDQLSIVMAHEAAHVQRHDPLLRFVARALSGFSLGRQTLLSQFVIASERACDEEAVKTSSRLSVAEVLLMLARHRHVPTPGLGIGHDALRERVAALCAEPIAETKSREMLRILLSCSAVALLTLSSHHVGETILGIAL